MKSAKKSASRSGTKTLVKLSKNAGVLDATKKAEENAQYWMYDAGYDIKQVEDKLRNQAQIDQQPFYVRIPAQGVSSIPYFICD